MAELNVEPKKTTNWWIWVLLAIILVGLVYVFLDGRKDATNNATSQAMQVPALATVDSGRMSQSDSSNYYI